MPGREVKSESLRHYLTMIYKKIDLRRKKIYNILYFVMKREAPMKYVKRTWTEIDLDAAAENFNTIRNAVNPKTKLCCVVKADGYGHGAARLAALYDRLGADFFAVSNLDEAKELRENDIDKPIINLGYTPPHCAKHLSYNNVCQTVYSLDYAEELSRQAVKAGVRCKIHIKLDTGMSRLGFMCQEFPRDMASVEEIYAACTLPNLVPDGIFTHFAVSDEGARGSEFTKAQIDNFLLVVNALGEKGIDFPTKHCSNSAAIEDYKDISLDMVRAGIILYGLSPSSKLDGKLALKPVMALKSVVSFVKEIRRGATVSYGRTFTAPGDMKIATVPIGYADGYIRQYAKDGYMLIKGKKAKIVGRICMDQTMVDVTDIDGVNMGDEVIVFGNGSHGEPTADDLAMWSDTINYEVLCIIGKRVPRLFTQNGKITDVMYKI